MDYRNVLCLLMIIAPLPKNVHFDHVLLVRFQVSTITIQCNFQLHLCDELSLVLLSEQVSVMICKQCDNLLSNSCQGCCSLGYTTLTEPERSLVTAVIHHPVIGDVMSQALNLS